MREIMLATQADKNEILKLYKSQLGREYCPWNEYYPEMEEIDFDLSRDSLFVMKDDGKIIAAITIDDDEEVTSLPYWTDELLPGAELSRLAVDTSLQGQGIAKEMVIYGMKEIKRRGFKSLHFLVNRNNVKALKCYSSFDFEKVGECEIFEQPMYCYEKAL
ncbi:Acetyltransferase (GNAT) family protein [Pseudobutyrivibrio sp. YE44]|uniref:GNAT family N-acetyltransferase n=1 Tax=Pseudobutyrivibrio sp. YE44 TaxID=1520802 RepID=UPI000883B08B|nr:GNAT family N-acetyltransferase [Pseudobutyrivibrio sp. YE44]SDB23749.1 Acetyltransferase (GNAT) family protein [Pseudobutyrivibrio sp. YE44]